MFAIEAVKVPVHSARAALWEWDFPAVGSSAVFEGVAQNGYGTFGSPSQPAAFNNQEPKYVKAMSHSLTISFLLLDQVSTCSSGHRAVVFALCGSLGRQKL